MTDDLDALRREIAEQLGWRITDEYHEDGCESHAPDWYGVDPDGDERPVPDWPCDLDAALALWQGVQWELSYLPTPAEHVPYTFVAFPPDTDAVGADGKTAAEAVARARLDYLKREG